MKLGIEDIPEEGLVLDLLEDNLKGGDESVASELTLASPVKAHLDISRSESDILMRGDVSGEILLGCARCLEEFCYTIHTSIEAVIHTGRHSFAGESELHKSDLDASYSEEGVIDTDEMLCEQLFLAVPIKPLCSPDCRGLCPTCGVSLEEGQCDCRSKATIDPRLAVLKGVRVDNKR
ncbi:MAG: DUF177 domain-containing protein [Thermodesulfobacteriota bacterium]